MDKIKNFLNLIIDNSSHINIYSNEIAIKEKSGLKLILEPIIHNDDFMLLDIEENNQRINKKYVLKTNDFKDEIIRIYDIQNYSMIKSLDLNNEGLTIFKNIHNSLINILDGKSYNKELYSNIEIDRGTKNSKSINIYLTERERNITNIISIDKINNDTQITSLLGYSVCNITFLENIIGENQKYRTKTVKFNIPNIEKHIFLEEVFDFSIENTFSKIKNKKLIEFLDLSFELEKKKDETQRPKQKI